MKKVLIALLAVMIVATAFVGCGGANDKDYDEGYAAGLEEGLASGIYKASQNVTVYGVAHKAYLGYMNAQTDAKGNLTQLILDEIFMPADWAKVNGTNDVVVVDEEELEVEYVTFTYRNAPVNVAKYIYFDGKKYTAELNDETNPTGVDYKNGSDSITKVYTDAALAKKYHDTAKNYYTTGKQTDSFKVGAGEDGETQVSVAFSTAAAAFKEGKFVMLAGNGAGSSFFKRESGYWANRGAGVVGLHANFDYILKYFRENGFDFKDSDIGETEEGTWTIGDIDTKATVTDFAEYVKLGRKLHTLLAK